MLIDCAIIGGGPAGLNAALILGRSGRQVLLFDDNKPRNAITRESHGFLTRDGIKPSEFKAIALVELKKYPSVSLQNTKIVSVKKEDGYFLVETINGESYKSRKVILATGLKEELPNIAGIKQFYGTSLFSCPYCDGWELKNKPLAVISDHEHVLDLVKLVYNWSGNLIVCTNGKNTITGDPKTELQGKGIRIYDSKIEAVSGMEGLIDTIRFVDGEEVVVKGGFITPEWIPTTIIGEALGCDIDEKGGLNTDYLGRTNIEGVYAAGDITTPSLLIIAAGEGSKAAIGVNTDLTNEDFSNEASRSDS